MGKSRKSTRKRKTRRKETVRAPATTDIASGKREPETPPRRRTSGRRLWLFRAVAVLLPFLLVGLLELILRFSGYGYPTDFFVETRKGDAYNSNLKFGWRFFPKVLARQPVPVYLPKKKSDDTYRIFVLGGSAAQGVPDPAFSFGRILEVMLAEAYPEVKFEIVNAAMTAINSHVVLPIARDSVDLHPDMLVVYMGNNEIVGPYGAGSIIRGFVPRLSMVRASVAVRATRVGQLIENIVTGLGLGGGVETEAWRGLEMFAGHRVAAGDERIETMYRHFRDNLRDICKVGADRRIPVTLCTVGVNLKDSPPFGSEHGVDLGTTDLDRWEEAFEAGVDLEAQGNCTGAMEHYRRAAKIDDRYAELHFRMGRCLLAQSAPAEAGEAFVRARDLDVLRFRVDSELNAIIRQVAADSEGVTLVDAEKAIGEAARVPGLPGEDLFYEHVHLTFEGNYVLARSVLEQIRDRLPPRFRSEAGSTPALPSLEACARRLALTPWNRRSMLQSILNMVRDQPFKSQLDHDETVRRLEAHFADPSLEATPQRASEARADYEKAIRERDGDILLRHNHARLLSALGDYASAESEFRAALELTADFPDLLFGLAVVVQAQDRAEEARRIFQRAVDSASNPAEMCGRIARNLHANDRFEEALYWAKRALEIRPQQSDALSIIGMIYFRRGEYERAIPYLRDLIVAASELAERDLADIHCHLAVSLSYIGEHEEAMRNLRSAIQIDPEFVKPRLLLAQALAGLGEPAEAEKWYQSVIELEPDNQQAHLDYVRLTAREKGCGAAIESSGKALENLPESPELLTVRAMLLATCEDRAFRDPSLAVAQAGKAAELTGFQQPEILNTWAVAFAENGQFERAVQIIDRALELTSGADGYAELVPELRRKRQMFQEHRRLTEGLR